MPHREDSAEPEFKLIQVKPLHLTVGAEITGVDFSGPVPDDVFKEIMAAITQVCALLPSFTFKTYLITQSADNLE